MGMKLKSGADLCGFQLTNFCVQGEASAPSDAALGRKYFHTNATDDVATGISLLHRERIYLGEGAWRATAYLDDIAAIQTKLDMILGDVDLDGVIENMNEVIKFLEDNKDTENLMTLLDDKLSKSKGGIMTGELCVQSDSTDASAYIAFKRGTDAKAYLLYSGGDDFNFYSEGWGKKYTFIHSGNIGGQKVASANKLISGTTNTLTASGTTLVDANGYQIYDTGSTWFAFGSTSAVGVYQGGSSVQLKTTKGYDTITAVFVNNSGNVTIGASDLAGTGYKLMVDGLLGMMNGTNKCGVLGFSDNNLYLGYSNVQFGTIVNGQTISFQTTNSSTPKVHITNGGNVGIGTTDPQYKLHIKGDLYVDGNIIATKEVSAGGAGAEEGTSGSGSAEGVSEIFTPTSTSMAFDHNLGEDVIVQVYEKSGNVWNMVIVDTEITSATRVTLRFGKTETTQHKVVIMGV